MNTGQPPSDFAGLWISRPVPNGARRETEYVAGVASGAFRDYDAHGALYREGGFVDGLFHGDLTTFDNNGEVLDVSRFQHRTGIFRHFMTSGQLGWEITVRAGKMHGPRTRRNWRGEIISVDHWCDGKLVRTDDGPGKRGS